MTGFTVLILIGLPLLIVSVTVALWPLRRRKVKIAVLGCHAVLSVLLMVAAGVDSLPYSVPVLGSGLLIVVLRLGTEAVDRIRESRA